MQRGDRAVEDSIAEKLEAFVVWSAVAAMSQRLSQQSGVAERVAEQ